MLQKHNNTGEMHLAHSISRAVHSPPPPAVETKVLYGVQYLGSSS